MFDEGEDAESADSGDLDAPVTGEAAVDSVLRAVVEVAERPVGDHVEVFEHAHEDLRRALDGTPADAPGHEQGA